MNEQQNRELNSLRVVADSAACCIIDLGTNLGEAHKEYMAGEIPDGAYNYVLGRHGALCLALHEAGYTEKAPLFGFPIKPKTDVAPNEPPLLRFIQIEVESENDEDLGCTYRITARLYYGPESLDPFSDGNSISIGDWTNHSPIDGRNLHEAFSECHEQWEAVAAVMGVPLKIHRGNGVEGI